MYGETLFGLLDRTGIIELQSVRICLKVRLCSNQTKPHRGEQPPRRAANPRTVGLIKQEINSVQAIKGKVDQGAIW